MEVVVSAGNVGWMCHGAAGEGGGGGTALAFVWAGQAQAQLRWQGAALVSCTQLPACLALVAASQLPGSPLLSGPDGSWLWLPTYSP